MIRNYDAIGRLSGVQNNTTSANYVSSIAYNAANEVTGFTYGNSVTASFGYSAERLQLTSLSYTQNSQTIFSLSYGYTQNNGNNGQKTQITDNVQSGRTLTYTYDSLKRLKTAVTNGSTPYPQWGLSWTYDRYGNRTQQSVTHGSGPSNSVTVSSSTNRITETGYTYDSNGNLTQDDLYKYKYDAENRLVELRLANDTLVATYTIDGHGLRVLKSVSGLRTWSVYDGTKLISEFEDSASATYTSGTTPGQAPSDADSTLLYQHADHLTTRFTTDNSGMSGNLQAHYPYGETWYNSGDADPSVVHKFSGLRKEPEATTGRLFSSPRGVYSARTGRPITPQTTSGKQGPPQRLNTLGTSASASFTCGGSCGPPIEPEGDNGCGVWIEGEYSVYCAVPGPKVPFWPPQKPPPDECVIYPLTEIMNIQCTQGATGTTQIRFKHQGINYGKKIYGQVDITKIYVEPDDEDKGNFDVLSQTARNLIPNETWEFDFQLRKTLAIGKLGLVRLEVEWTCKAEKQEPIVKFMEAFRCSKPLR